MYRVIKPIKQPPKLDEYEDLSEEAQRTIRALKKKYTLRINEISNTRCNWECDLKPAISLKGAEHYYKHIYDASFKRENLTPVKDLDPSTTESYEHSEYHNPFKFDSNRKRHGAAPIVPITLSLCDDLNVVKTKMKETKISQNKRVVNRNLRVDVNSPCLDLSPSTHFDTEEVGNHSPLAQALSESPITLVSQGFIAPYQKSPKHKLYGRMGEKKVPDGKKSTSSYPFPFLPILSESPITMVSQGSLVQHQEPPKHKLYGLMGEKKILDSKKKTSSSMRKEDSLQSLSAFSPICSPLLYDEKPFPNKTPVMKNSALGQEKKESNKYPSSPEEADFDLRLSGFSPLAGNIVNNSSAVEESPLGLSQRSLQRKDGNGNCMDVQESPFLLKKSESLSEKCPNKDLQPASETMESPLVHSQRSLQRRNGGNCMDDQESPLLFKESESLSEKCHNKEWQPVSETKQTTLKKGKKRKAQSAGGGAKDKKPLGKEEKPKSGFHLPKRGKSKFLPPTQLSLSSVSPNRNIDQRSLTSAKEDRERTLPSVVQFFTLNVQEQEKARSFIESSQRLCLTVLYTNGEALVNTFYTAADHAKKKSFVCKSIAASITGKSVNILTPNNVCYELTISLETVEVTRHILSSLLNDAKCEMIIANLKDFLNFMIKVLKCDIKQEITCKEIHDPVLASWLINPDVQPSSFKHLCQTAGFSVNSNEWLSCLCAVEKLMIALKKQLLTEKLWNLYTKIEMKLVPILACMECCKLKVDMKTFIQFSDIIKSKLHKLEEKAYDAVGHKFSINSHPQLRHVLYEELKLDKKLPSKSKIGKTNVAHQKSTSESALNLMKDVHSLPQIVLEYRSLQKMVSTYVEGLMTCVTDGSLSTHWDQTAAATGRLTSSQPNIQTVPKAPMIIEDYKTNFIAGSESTVTAELYAREPFVSRDGYSFLAADFQQIELRIFAHLSHDKTLLSMFWKPDSGDIFNLLTSEWHDKSVDLVTSEDREQTKRVVYSVMYGAGKEKLSEYLKIPPESARDIMHSFLVRFPCINAFSKKCTAFAEEYGFTETICGRKRHFPNIRSSSPNLKAQAQRQAINFCVQGSAADICKQAMIKVETELSEHTDLQCRLLLQIHDELVWEVSENQIFQVKVTVILSPTDLAIAFRHLNSLWDIQCNARKAHCTSLLTRSVPAYNYNQVLIHTGVK